MTPRAPATILRPLRAPDDVALVQRVLDDAPAFFRLSHGDVARADEAERLFTELPPGRSRDDKRVWAIAVAGIDEAAGVVELVRRWPNDDTAIIGLLVVRERYHRRGIASAALREVERVVRDELRHRRLRIGVLEENHAALAFWRAMGFAPTGERKPWRDGTVATHVIVLEK